MFTVSGANLSVLFPEKWVKKQARQKPGLFNFA